MKPRRGSYLAEREGEAPQRRHLFDISRAQLWLGLVGGFLAVFTSVVSGMAAGANLVVPPIVRRTMVADLARVDRELARVEAECKTNDDRMASERKEQLAALTTELRKTRETMDALLLALADPGRRR